MKNIKILAMMSMLCTWVVDSSIMAKTIMLQNRTVQPCTASTTELSATPFSGSDMVINILSQGDHLTILFTGLGKQLNVTSIDPNSFGNVLRIIDQNGGIGTFNPAVCDEANVPLANQTVS